MRTVRKSILLFLGLACAASCREREAENTALASTEESQSTVSEVLELAQQKLKPFVFGPTDLKYASAHAMSIGQCDGFWAHAILDLPSAGLAAPSAGVHIYFSDREELATFARSAILFGDKISVQDEAGVHHAVSVCGRFGEPVVIHPAVSGGNQN